MRQTLQAAQSALGVVKNERDQFTYQVRELSAARVELDRRLETAQQAMTEAKIMGATMQKQAEMLAQQLVSAEARAEKADQERLGLIQKLTEQEHIPSVAHKIKQL